ncbi:MAG: type II secretion system protein GspC [endosymbiont of Galathealinum brachiosum]|uniref:Type II secretion system protein GspC n=1 Tax=endosymbiont of Galathealinum brachiosum TaxID=2200906 RepID=A0A370DJU9_9GAMM|nr:MAG: type II secretion system protein GspC [endosymbiont of Galathealinum brachiosum]
MSQSLLTRLTHLDYPKVVIKKLPVAITIVLIIFCAHKLSQITLALFSDSPVSNTTNNSLIKSSIKTNHKQNYESIIAANLFGSPEKTIKPTQIKAPETKLNLTLKGVFFTTPMIHSTAIISEGKNGKEESYNIGDKITGSAIIKEIWNDHVVITRNGHSEILRIIKDEMLGEVFSFIPDFKNLKPLVAKTPLDIIRLKIIDNPYLLIDYADAEAVKVNGKQIGYQLFPKKMGSTTIAEIGIEPGDVITSLNNVKLINAKNAKIALTKLVTDRDVTISVNRKNSKLSIRVELQ